MVLQASGSSTGTFQAVDPRKRWNGISTTIVNVDTHERHEWTDTEDNASVIVKKAPPPFYQNRTASQPTLLNSRNEEPFNYIAFSQQLYGHQKSVESDHDRSKKPRTVSYV